MNPSSQANPSRLPLLAALCIGIAIGALVISALNSQPRTVPVEVEPGVQVEELVAPIVESVEAQTRAQTEALIRLETLMHDVLTRPAPTPGAGIEQGGLVRQPIETAAGPATIEESSAANWIEVLDKDVARSLVERGLTPYDPGIADHIRKAGTKLRSLRDIWRAAQRQLYDENRGGLLSSQDLNDAMRSMSDEHTGKRREILAALEAALGALSKGAGEADDD